MLSTITAPRSVASTPTLPPSPKSTCTSSVTRSSLERRDLLIGVDREDREQPDQDQRDPAQNRVACDLPSKAAV